jgi:heat-inducible transcriptional repressor
MQDGRPELGDLNARSRDVFRRLVETYLETGEPVGSRTLSKQLDMQVSAATIRNIMQDLESLGMLDSPHVSAGRIPTQSGLRLFVDGLLQIGDIDEQERGAIDQAMGVVDGDVAAVLDEAGAMLSGSRIAPRWSSRPRPRRRSSTWNSWPSPPTAPSR